MKRIVSFFTAALLLTLTLALPVLAAEDEVKVTGNTYYNTREDKFVIYGQEAAEGITLYSSVADGMIVTQTVGLRSDQMAALELYRNGNRVEDFTAGSVSQHGEYVVMYTGGDVPQQLLSFTIAPKLTNRITGYTVPEGFEIISATLNEEPVAYQRNHIDMTTEGAYDIHYRCTRTGIPYQLMLTADHTGPTLALAAVKNGVARGPVDISDAKKAASIIIYRDGEKISRADVLKQSGEYYIELADEAGNKTTYTFTIMVYFDGNSWLFILILVLTVAGTVAYLIYARKHLRVR